jgi:cytochrome P450
MLLHAQDEGKMMTREQVRNQLMTLIAAGHETTTNSLLWTFYLLSEHPDVHEKLLGEIQTVLAGRDAKMEDLAKLRYLDWVIKESMRIYPSGWTQGRRAVEAFDLDGYHFPAGTLLMFSQWSLHHLPDVWGDPENFRPERWDPESGQSAPTWAYFPFGGGSRICIGTSLAQMELRLVTATILQHYTPRLVPGFPVVPQPLITLGPKYGLRMIVDPAPAQTAKSGAAHMEA